MNQGKIPVRYARALFQSALEKGIEGEVYNDMLMILEVSSLSDFRDIMTNAVVKPGKKVSIVNEVFDGKINPLTLRLLNIVIDNGRGDYINGVARMYIDEIRRQKGITPVHLTTSAPIEEILQEKIGKEVGKVFNTKVEMSGEVKDDLIGGFVLRIGDRYLDLSIKKKLALIKKELISN